MAKIEAVSLTLVSALALFLELVLIRWLPANILSLAYFSNIVLISCFLGLGLGCLLSRRRDMFHGFPPALLLFILIVLYLQRFEVVVPPEKNEWIWSYYTANQLDPQSLKIGILPALVLIYSMTTVLFAFLGQRMAKLMENFAPLTAYTLNILGSILGIALFSGLCFAGTKFSSPTVWFSAAGALTLWFFRDSRPKLAVGALCVAAATAMAWHHSRGEIWSPYYSIQARGDPNGGFKVFVNRFFHQSAIDFDSNKNAAAKYGIPYLLARPEKVLILGAGTGNDVAIAARHGARQIDAVEIDPDIARLGMDLHPARPYQNPGVKIFIDDARSFLRKSREKYDMIVLGTLDSHALLSGMSTVRLDNFVYTEESLRSVKDHLTERGIAVLMFSVPVDWLGYKLLGLCSAVFTDPPPAAYVGDSYLFNLMVVAGPGLIDGLKNFPPGKSPFRTVSGAPDRETLPTDDWPYLYLSKRTVPAHYLKAVAVLAAFSVLAIFLIAPRGAGGPNLHFFFLGCGFLLLETKSVTTLSLLFGSTWVVNAFVFAAILWMILLANLLVEKAGGNKVNLAYAGLGLALALNYFVPVNLFLNENFWLKAALSSLFAALPIFFSAVIFACHFRSVQDIGAVYGVNLMGAVLGGFLEYGSMRVGLNNLFLAAGVFYLLAFLFRRHGHAAAVKTA